MSRQNYYAQRKERQRGVVDAEFVMGLVHQERALQPRLGTRKLYHLIKEKFDDARVKVGRSPAFWSVWSRGRHDDSPAAANV